MGAYESPVREQLLRGGLSRAPGACRCSARTAHRRPRRHPQDARRLRAGGRRAAADLRHPVGPGHPERPALPGDRGQEPAARGRQPAQVASSSPTCPTSCARRSTRSSASRRCCCERMFGELNEKQDGVPAGHPRLGPAPPVPDQRHPRPVQDRGRADGARTGRLPSPDGARQRADPGARAGRSNTWRRWRR